MLLLTLCIAKMVKITLAQIPTTLYKILTQQNLPFPEMEGEFPSSLMLVGKLCSLTKGSFSR